MINYLTIQNYTIIENLKIDFEKGLNIITGETGAGKSIIIDAIDIALGAKIPKDVVKTGKNKALIELEISLSDKIAEVFASQFDIEPEDGNVVIFSKEITETSSRTRVNGVVIPQNTLLEMRRFILDIHSQHQTYVYMQPKLHINLLDNFGDKSYRESVLEFQKLFKDFQELEAKYKKLLENNTKNEQEKDFLKFQIEEIQAANIEDPNEYEELFAKMEICANAQELKTLSFGAYSALYEEEGAVIDRLNEIKSTLSKGAYFDEKLSAIAQNIEETVITLKDSAHELRSHHENLNFDPELLEEIQTRLDILSKLKRKYGGDLQSVLDTLEKYLQEYDELENSTDNIVKYEQQLKAMRTFIDEKASKISNVRAQLAQELSLTVSEELKKLEMPYAEFSVNIEQIPVSANGTDNVEFMIITNPAEEFKPLARIASGGEISRVMLAIKTIFAKADDIMSVIFDEIDTGISGKTSEAIARNLSLLANSHQILCITHQPIIASVADVHFHVSKNQSTNSFEVLVEKLTEEQKTNVISKMLSGKQDEESVEFAKKLIKDLKQVY
ncbi:MAG: DNA repair protein RecN [Candidatus Gastranaerophilales bacterium]|nr:DNA repair protein RecN [Candidatus Gastranaerophilales bacterium]